MNATAITACGIAAGYDNGPDIIQGLHVTTGARNVTLILGPNGAGKSTTLKAIFGFIPLRRGRVMLGNQDLTGLQPHAIKASGVSYIPQDPNVFPQMTVEENLRMGGWTKKKDKTQLRANLDRVYSIFPALYEKRKRNAHELSGGQAKMLAISREVMTDPEVILVDEPTAGLAPNVSSQAYEFLMAVRQLTESQILLVDQRVESALEVADYVYMLNLGVVAYEGPASDFPLARVRELTKELLHG